MAETEGLTSNQIDFVDLVSITGSGDLNFHQENICSVFNNSATREMPAGVVSVIGAEVYTKSSMLLNLARFATHEYGTSVDLQLSTVPETDSKIVTSSKPLLVEFDMDRKLGLFLIGTKSSMTSQTQLSGIVATLATISSHMIFLTSSSVQMEDFVWLRDLDRRKIELDQLTILVQNWDKPKVFLFGGTGGKNFLNQFFQAQPEASDLLRRVVRSVNCFLMPKEDDSVFNKNLTQFLSRTVGRLYLSPKEISGKVLLCGSIPKLFESYTSMTETGTFEAQAEEVMDTSEEIENPNDTVEEMNIDPPQIYSEEFDKNDDSANSNFENPDRLASTKLSLEEYLKRRENTDNLHNSTTEDPVISDSLDQIPEIQFTPEDILKKYAKPALNPHFDLPKNFNVVLPRSSDEIMLVEPTGTGVSDINVTSVNFMVDCHTTASVEIESSPTNFFDIQEISDDQMHSNDTSNHFNLTEVSRDENERRIPEESLFQNAISNFKRIPILHSHITAQENWYKESFETTSEGVYGQIDTSNLRKKFSHYFGLWRRYDHGIGQLYSSPAKTLTEFAEFHERFKRGWFSVKIVDLCDKQLEEITIEKIDQTFRMILEQLGIEKQSIDYANAVAIKYYHHEMKDHSRSHESVRKKLVYTFTQANKFQNEAWKQFYTKELERKLDELKPKRLNTPTPVPAPTKSLDPEPKICQTTQKLTDSEIIEKAISKCLKYYQSEIDRDMKFGRAKELSQLQEVHNVAKDQSIRKFKKETVSLNGQWLETSYTNLLKKIEEEYSSYKRVTEMKLENDVSECNQKSSTQRGTAAAEINCTRPTVPLCDNFIGIHACNSYIKGAVRLNQAFRILPGMSQAKLDHMSPEGLERIMEEFKLYFENELKSDLVNCVIAIPMSWAENMSQLTVAVRNQEIQTPEIISETCAVALGFFKENNKIQNLIVILCGIDANRSAGAYTYEERNRAVRLLEPFMEEITKIKGAHSRYKATDIVKYLATKVKEFDILLVGSQSEIVPAKQEISHSGLYRHNGIHLRKAEAIVESSILYASEIFKASGNGVRICADNLKVVSSTIVKQKKNQAGFSCSLL